MNAIHPSQIESTLQSLQQREQDSNLIKASLFNLVIYTKEDDRETYFMDLCKSLIRKFPCRILFFKESSEKSDFLETTVSALKPDGDDTGFFCEFIHFSISENIKCRIPYLLTPYLTADLPVYLLFGNDPSVNDCLSSLHINQAVDRIIFDSECVEHMTTFSSYMTNLIDKQIDIGDLNWARFSPWRALFGKFFSTEEKVQTLQSCDTITIKYNTHATKSFFHNKIQASYLQAWIAQKLGWKFEKVTSEKSSIYVSYKSNTQIHKIEIIGDAPQESLPPGRITEISINSKDNHAQFIRDKNSPHLVTTSFNTNQTCHLPLLYPLTKEGSGMSLQREIYFRGTDSDFANALNLLSNWQPGVICS